MHRLIRPESIMGRDEALRQFGIEFADCPFCHSSYVGLFLGPHPHVVCCHCAADGPPTMDRNPQQAIINWNARKPTETPSYGEQRQRPRRR